MNLDLTAIALAALALIAAAAGLYGFVYIAKGPEPTPTYECHNCTTITLHGRGHVIDYASQGSTDEGGPTTQPRNVRGEARDAQVKAILERIRREQDALIERSNGE